MKRFIDWRDPLTYGVIVALIILILFGLTACARKMAQDSALPKQAPASSPKTSDDARTREGALRSDIEGLQQQLDRAQADTKRLEGQESRARWVVLARVIQVAAAFAMIGGAALGAFSFFNPALRPLRMLAFVGGGAAVIVFGLAAYLPTAAVWLGPIALVLTIGGVIWTGWELYRAR